MKYTSGELNFLTPNSAKDIQREFTAGIKERCKLPVINCQAVTTVLDPVTGNISTVLTTTSPQAETATTAAASKKPSYLNLACCVNGYSNLTTYDSKLRQDINKSREVSPNRPIIATLHYNRSESGNFQLTAPTLSYISMNNSINNNISNGGSKFGAMVNGAGRFANGGGGATIAGQDVTDNAMFNGNGFGGGGLRTKVISSQSQISSVKETDKVVKKSFIQQRVEKLYGNAEGVVINKQIYNSNERKYLNNIANENVNKNYTNALHMNGNGNVAANCGNQHSIVGAGGGGGLGFGGGGTKENLDENNKEIADAPDMEALPVMRHLRPEFRAQLQIFSPKKIPKTSPSRSIASAGSGTVSQNGSANNNHIISNGDLSHHNHHSQLAKAKVISNGTTASLTSASSVFTSSSSSSSPSSSVESKREQRSTTISTGLNTTTSSTTTTTASREFRSESLVESLSAVTSAEPVTFGDNNNSSTQESRSGATAVVIEQAANEQQPIIGAEQKMKLSEPTMVVNGGDGGNCPTSDVAIRNGTSRKNGHHPLVDEDKENLNDDRLLEVTPMTKTQLKDGNYFLQVLKNEQNRLLTMAADIERDVEQLKTDGVEISEEIAGYVLAAAGKARLLCSKKMKQFEGLCYNNLNQSPDEKFQTTSEDLRGFWDMVMLQVNDVDASFGEIDLFRRNGWKKPEPKSPIPQVRSTARSTKLTKRPYKTPSNGTSNGITAEGSAADSKKASAAAAAARREAQRKQLLELKRKQKLASSQQNVEIFVPEANGKTTVTCTDTNGIPPVDAS